MNRLNRYLLGASAALLAVAAQTPGADLLVDNFTDPAASSALWIKELNSTMTVAVNGGSCTLDNSASQYMGEYRHDFSGSKPATFTLSYVLKSAQGNNLVGAFFCRQPDNPTGYILTAEGDYAVVYKVAMTGNSINAAPIFHEKSFDLMPADNKLTVSKNGSTFHVFTNDVFVGSFIDASYNSGDLSLVMFGNTQAVFGALRVTDTFTPGQKRTEFSDNFDDNAINKYWRQDIKSVDGPEPIVTETGGKLRMTAGANAGAYIYVDIDLTDFEAKVEVNHAAGRADAPYGIFLIGKGASEMVKFFIVGGRYYGVWKSGDGTQTMAPNAKIHGSEPVAGAVLSDTLTIRKKDNSPNYEFLVNGEQLTFNLSPVNFPIKGIGLLCDNDVTAAFDNFSVKQTAPTVSIRKNDKKQVSRGPSPAAITDNHAFYDMRGRKRYSTAPNQMRAQTRAAGVYVNKNGRDVAVTERKSR